MTPSSGIWNPTIKTVGDLVKEEEKIIPIHLIDEEIPVVSDLEEMLFLADLRDELQSVFKWITDREEQVIRLRFGLGDGYPRTLEEVAVALRLTRERVRQIERKALGKLRVLSCAFGIKEFYAEPKGEPIARCSSLNETTDAATVAA